MLTERECRTAGPGDKDRKLFDGGGLHLLIKPTGYRSWRLKYRFGGKEKQLTFGAYPGISLKEARLQREDAKRLLSNGMDPGGQARRNLAKRAGKEQTGPTFRQAAIRWHQLQSEGWKPRHAEQVLAQLEKDILPTLGGMEIGEVTSSDIRQLIDIMQDRGAIDQTHRMLMRISRIFKLAIVDELVDADPAQVLSAILKPVPKRKFPAILRLDQARSALASFEAEAHWPQVKLASRLLALAAPRPGPLRFAQPAEFHDLDGREPRWIIPTEKMKLQRAESEQSAYDFTIPLSVQAAAVVKLAIKEAGKRPYLFPSPQFAKRPISENALSSAYRKSDAFGARHVPHGWRSTFSTLMNERASELNNPGDRAVLDLMLAHQPRGVEAHYNRASYMTRRRQLAQEWADLLCEGLVPPSELVVGPRN